MKKIIVILIALVAVTTANAQDKKNVIKINPLSLALTNISLSYERILSDKMSVQLQAGYMLGAKVGDAKFGGITLTPELRYYVTNHERPKGFYVAAFGKYQQFSASSETGAGTGGYDIKINRIGGGAGAGFQFLFGEAVTLDLFTGPQFFSNSIDQKYDDPTAERIDFDRLSGNFGLRFAMTLGFAF